MNSKSSQYAFRLLNKCLWKGGAEDMYKSSLRKAGSISLLNRKKPSSSYSTRPNLSQKTLSSNPMLNGVSMLQWFFDEVRPDQREVRYWMKYFHQTTDPNRIFAVMQISKDVFAQEELDLVEKENGKLKRTILETLSLSMYFLQQNRMKVVLLVGADRDCAESDTTFKEDRKLIYKHIKTVVDRLDESGTRSTPVFDGGNIFNTDRDFRIQSLNTENLDWLMSHDNVPVIGCIGENPEGRLGLVQADDGTHTLSTYTQPLKVLLLNAGGGISDSSGERVTVVFLPQAAELQKFVNLPWWNTTVKDRFIKVCDILKVLPKASSYVITSASDVLTELLTQRGVGTLFKRVAPVNKYRSLNDWVKVGDCIENEQQLKDILPDLVENAFGRQTSRSYWNKLSADLDAIYVTDDLKSCAVVRKIHGMPGVAYLDKFAVCKEERGNFSIDVLWQQLKQDYTSLYWRSRRTNIFNSWYEARSDGIVKSGYYHIFWFGLNSTDINSVVKLCETLPDSFDS